MKQFAQQAHRIMTGSMELERLILTLGAPDEGEKKYNHTFLKNKTDLLFCCVTTPSLPTYFFIYFYIYRF